MRRAGVLAFAAALLALVVSSPLPARAEHEPGHPAQHVPSERAAEEAHRLENVEVAEQAPGEELPHGHAEPLDGGKLAAQIVNFIILVGLLIFFGRKAISKALTARHQQLKAELAAASEQRAAAQARLAQQEKRLATLENEIAEMRAGIHREAEVEKARLIELAEERARRIQEETKFLLDQQVKEAQGELRREAARAAVDLAEQMVKRSLNAGDQQRLVDSFVGDVAARPPRSNI